MNWDDARFLHLEITSRCNSVCPSCSRFRNFGYETSPEINKEQNWTFEQVESRLPKEKLGSIKHLYFNGTVGDFCANPYALEITEYLYKHSNNPKITVNTNGGLRNKNWWGELGKIPNITVNFALDGLEDTHSLYRRETNWNKILENAKNFIANGGTAVWTMTIFKHNQHQIEACRTLSQQLGFQRFESRFHDRSTGLTADRNGNPSHRIEHADNSPIRGLTHALNDSHIHMVHFPMKTAQYKIKIKPLESLNLCQVHGRKEVYINSKWQVAPCCYIGNVFFSNYHYIDELNEKLQKYNLSIEHVTSTDDKTVPEIVDHGFGYAFNYLTKPDILSVCHTSCGNNSSYTVARNNKTS